MPALSNKPTRDQVRNVEGRLEEIAQEIELLQIAADMRIGQLLAEARDLYRYRRDEHGFAGWVKTRLGYTRQTAYNRIHAYENLSNRFDTFPPTIRYRLAAPSTPPSAREEVLARVETGVATTKAETEEIIKRHKQKLLPAPEVTADQPVTPAAEEPPPASPKTTPGQVVISAESRCAEFAADEEEAAEQPPASAENNNIGSLADSSEPGEPDPPVDKRQPGVTGLLMTQERWALVNVARGALGSLTLGEKCEALAQTLQYRNEDFAEKLLPIVVGHLPEPVRTRSGKPRRLARPIADPLAKVAKVLIHALDVAHDHKKADVAIADLKAISNFLERSELEPRDLARALEAAQPPARTTTTTREAGKSISDPPKTAPAPKPEPESREFEYPVLPTFLDRNRKPPQPE